MAHHIKNKYFLQEDDSFLEDFDVSSREGQFNRFGMAVANGDTIDLLQSTGKRDFDVATHKQARDDLLRGRRHLAADPNKVQARVVVIAKKRVKLTSFLDPVRALTEITTFQCCASKCMQVHFSFYCLNV